MKPVYNIFKCSVVYLSNNLTLYERELGITGELMLKDYRESHFGNEFEARFEGSSCIDEKSPFVIVVDGKENEKVVRKSSLCWLLSKDKHKLSSDRLVRVTEKDYSQDYSVKTSSNILLT